MRLSLTQKVFFSLAGLFIISSISLSLLVSSLFRQSYLAEQKQNVAQFVNKQAEQHLKPEDFQVNSLNTGMEKYQLYENEIITKEIVRLKIYSTNGVVVYSDQKELIGKNLFADDPNELNELLAGNVVADIADLTKPENIFEKQYGQLLEIYTPIRYKGGPVVGIVETYYTISTLNAQIGKIEPYVIGSIAGIFTVLFVLLYLIVRQASRTLINQDKRLQEDIVREKEYSAMKDDFIRLSSHQLRTPTSAIKWSVELLSEDDKYTKEQKDLLDSITQNAQVLNSIVNNLLIVSDIKQDYFTREIKNYSISELINHVLTETKKNAEAKKIKVEYVNELVKDSIDYRKDAVLNVIRILVANAIDYSFESGKIELMVSGADNKLIFSCQDFGIGIPKDEQSMIFNQFFRSRNSISKKNVGSGLSLYIAKKIIEGFGGKIGFTSDEKNTRFYFELPIALK